MSEVDAARPADVSRDAMRACGEWLKACLDLGWSRDDLDWLEVLWWRHHDKRGRLKSAVKEP